MTTRTGLMAGRRALVTGAASGIGAAAARRLADEGAAVALADRDGPGADRVAALLRDAGHTAYALQLDVTDDAQVAEVVATAVAALGGLDVVIANAGVLRLGTLAETTPDLLRLCLEVNVVGTLATVRHAVPHMTNGGSIVCTASVAGLEGAPELTAYCASKFAVVGIVQSLARELAQDGIRVNAVAPGLVDTPMLASFFAERARIRGVPAEQVKREGLSHVPIGRLADPAEIADTMLFLALDLSTYISGVTMPVLGGELAG